MKEKCPDYCGSSKRETALEIPLRRVRRRKMGEEGMEILGMIKSTEG